MLILWYAADDVVHVAISRHLVILGKLKYWLIFMKFYNKVPNHKKVCIDLGSYGPNRFRFMGQKRGENKHFYEFNYITSVKEWEHL